MNISVPIDTMKDDNLKSMLCEESKEMQDSFMNCKDDTEEKTM